MFVPVSLIVPPFNATAFAPIESTSPAFVAAFAAAIANVNTNSLVPVPLAYDNVLFARWSLTTVNCGVPVTILLLKSSIKSHFLFLVYKTLKKLRK